jgi:hypothetical protein
MLSGDLPYERENEEIIGLAFVREPVSRFVSSYNFQRGDTYLGGHAKHHVFEEFVRKALVEEDNPWWRNGQTFTLGGSGDEEGLSRVRERVSKGQLILLPTERFDECCVLLERLFPGEFSDCRYTRLNVSQRRETGSEMERDTIAKYMERDSELWNYANEFLDLKLRGIFPTEVQQQEYMREFQRRCNRLPIRERLGILEKKVRRAARGVLGRMAGSG